MYGAFALRRGTIFLTGTLINVGAVVAGGLLGTLIGSRLPDRARKTAMDGLGLATLSIGLKMSFETANVLYVLGALLVGALIGEALDIDAAITRLGDAAEKAVTGSSAGNESGKFARGFVVTSLLVCVGPMAILGSIQDGLAGNISTLTVKSALDGIAALAFASSLGPGVAFAGLPLLVYQGALTAGARFFQSALTPPLVAEFTATGGLLVFAVGLGLLEVKRIKVANLLPAVFIAPLLVCLAGFFR